MFVAFSILRFGTYLMNIYTAAAREKFATGSLSNTRTSVLSSLTDREKAMYGYLRLIVFKNLPIEYVTDKDVRSFSKYSAQFCLSTFKETLFKLVKIVEKKIELELNQVKGSITYDGWTHSNSHYVGVFAVYMRDISVQKHVELTKTKELAMTLLAASPMASPCASEDGADAETTSFSASVHIRFSKTCFIFTARRCTSGRYVKWPITATRTSALRT